VVSVEAGPTYTTDVGDCGATVSLTNAGTKAVTLDNTAFSSGMFVTIRNSGNGLATLTPSSGTVAGGATLPIALGQWATLAYDGTNWVMVQNNRVTTGSGLSQANDENGIVIDIAPEVLTTIGVQTVTDKTLIASTNSVGPLAIKNGCTDSVGTDSYACALSPVLTAYSNGGMYWFIAGTANTGAATIDLGPGVKTIKKVAGGVTTDLATNDIRIGQVVLIQYDGTNMQMQSTLGNAASGGGGKFIVVTQHIVPAGAVQVTAASSFSTSLYQPIRLNATSAEDDMAVPMPTATTATKLCVRTFYGTQPADGALTVTLRKDTAGNGTFASTSLVATVPANGVAGLYCDTMNSASISADDKIVLLIENTASTVSGYLASISMELANL